MHVTVLLSDLVGSSEPDPGTTNSGQGQKIGSGRTILDRAKASGGGLSSWEAIDVLSLLPPVVGLTPDYTPRAVMMINMARVVKALIPFAFD